MRNPVLRSLYVKLDFLIFWNFGQFLLNIFSVRLIREYIRYVSFFSWINQDWVQDPGMALGLFPSSVGWYKIQIHYLLIVSLVCNPYDQTFAPKLMRSRCPLPTVSLPRKNNLDSWWLRIEVGLFYILRILSFTVLKYFTATTHVLQL